MGHHLTHDIGWPTLCLCAFVLGLIIPGLIAWIRFEIRLSRRLRRWDHVREPRHARVYW